MGSVCQWRRACVRACVMCVCVCVPARVRETTAEKLERGRKFSRCRFSKGGEGGIENEVKLLC